MVSDDKLPHLTHLYSYKNTVEFKEDLEFLLKNYTPIDLPELLCSLDNKRTVNRKSFHLTFDDGFREMHDVVAPILSEKGITATFFVNTAFIDNKILPYEHKISILLSQIKADQTASYAAVIEQLLSKGSQFFPDHESATMSGDEGESIVDQLAARIGTDFEDYLHKYQPFLSSEQITRLINAGFSIGGHSINHPHFSSIPLHDQLFQTIESVKYVRDTFSLKYGVFAFPYSDRGISKKFFDGAFASSLIDATFGNSGIFNDSIPSHFQRFSLEKPLAPAKRLIRLQYVRTLFKHATRRDIMCRP